MDPLTLAFLFAMALATSTISGAMGMGGGIALVGAMAAVLPLALVVPLHGMIQLISNFSRTLAYLRDVHWRIFSIYVLPMTVGVGMAGLVWSGSTLDWLRPFIGAYLLVFLVWRRKRPQLTTTPLWTFAPLGFTAGFLAIFVGATGPFIAPFFLRDDLRKEQIVATKAVCQTGSHLLKIPTFLALGFPYLDHIQPLVLLGVAVVAGTLLGKRILSWMSEAQFIQLFELLLGTIGVYLIVSALLA